MISPPVPLEPCEPCYYTYRPRIAPAIACGPCAAWSLGLGNQFRIYSVHYDILRSTPAPRKATSTDTEDVPSTRSLISMRACSRTPCSCLPCRPVALTSPCRRPRSVDTFCTNCAEHPTASSIRQGVEGLYPWWETSPPDVIDAVKRAGGACSTLGMAVRMMCLVGPGGFLRRRTARITKRK